MKNKGLLHSGVTNVTQEEPLRTYMDKRGATYYFRRVVPEPLRPYLLTESGKPRIEFMISLRTKDRREANDRLERESIRVSALINEAQRRFDAGIPHTAKAKSGSDPRQDAREVYEREAERYTAAQIAHGEVERDDDFDTVLRLVNELSKRDKNFRSDLAFQLSHSDEEMAARERDALAEWEQGALEANEAFERTGGVAMAVSVQAGSAPVYPRLMDIFDRYAEVRQLAPATVKSWRKPIQHLIEYAGSDNAKALDLEKLKGWRNLLLSEPTRLGGTRSTKTVRDTYIAAVKTILGYAYDENEIDTNPAENLKVRAVRQVVRRVSKAFTSEEATTILKAALDGANDGKMTAETRLARRWVPWLCAYTGARVNEITQLRQKDICEMDGVWIIKLTPDAGSIKTRKARIVPLHPHLIDQGFHRLAGDSEKPIFYDPSNGRGGSDENPHNHKIAERLAKWVRELGVSDPAVRPNHGWRHLFKTRGNRAGVAEAALDAMLGHAPANEGRKYGDWDAPSLKREIDKMERFEIDT